MNKQALAFLTMFSLILMLSVYYVTLPADSTSVMEEQAPQSDKKADKENTAAKTEDAQGKTEEAQEQKKDTSESADGSTKLQDSINQKKEEEINRNSSVVADTKSDDSAKKEALAAIDELKDEKSMQKSVADLLKKDGYQQLWKSMEIRVSSRCLNRRMIKMLRKRSCRRHRKLQITNI